MGGRRHARAKKIISAPFGRTAGPDVTVSVPNQGSGELSVIAGGVSNGHDRVAEKGGDACPSAESQVKARPRAMPRIEINLAIGR